MKTSAPTGIAQAHKPNAEGFLRTLNLFPLPCPGTPEFIPVSGHLSLEREKVYNIIIHLLVKKKKITGTSKGKSNPEPYLMSIMCFLSSQTAQLFRASGVIFQLPFGPALTNPHPRLVWGEFILTSKSLHPTAPLLQQIPTLGQDMACIRLAPPHPPLRLSLGTILWHLR